MLKGRFEGRGGGGGAPFKEQFEGTFLKTTPACRWDGVKRPQSFWKVLDFPELPGTSYFLRSSPATSPELLSQDSKDNPLKR